MRWFFTLSLSVRSLSKKKRYPWGFTVLCLQNFQGNPWMMGIIRFPEAPDFSWKGKSHHQSSWVSSVGRLLPQGSSSLHIKRTRKEELLHGSSWAPLAQGCKHSSVYTQPSLESINLLMCTILWANILIKFINYHLLFNQKNIKRLHY